MTIPTRTLRQQASPHDGSTGQEQPGSQQASETDSQHYDPWAVLGLKPGASTNDIRLRYHELMREFHPSLAKTANGGDPIRLAQINKAYDLITKSPTLDRRFRNLVSESQYHYYKVLPDWMARNVDEMPRYWSWFKWRLKGSAQTAMILGTLCFFIGTCFKNWPVLTTVLFVSFGLDILLHTTAAPGVLGMLFIKMCATTRAHDLSWVMSMKATLQRDLTY